MRWSLGRKKGLAMVRMRLERLEDGNDVCVCVCVIISHLHDTRTPTHFLSIALSIEDEGNHLVEAIG